MPYIKADNREKFDRHLEKIKDLNFGEFYYFAYNLIKGSIELQGINYSNMNNHIGVLECCRLEVRRKKGVPYPYTEACTIEIEREDFLPQLDAVISTILKFTPGYGDLNYCIYVLALTLIAKYKDTYHCNLAINSINRELRKVIDEIYLTLIAPYEQLKIEENGDVNV